MSIRLNAGVGGALLASESDGTQEHQQMLLEFGLPGSQTRVSTQNPLPVAAQPGRFQSTNRGGSVAVGGTSQQIMAANASRQLLIVQNPNTETEVLTVNFGAPASLNSGTPDSIELPPGESVWQDAATGIENGTVNVTAATPGHKFIAKEA